MKLRKRSSHPLAACLAAAYGALSPAKVALFGPSARCRFTPSCSAYARGCVERHGLLRALPLVLGRILRCHPFARGGHDPVP
jgi:putative membrane protein insertion efficiency factor